MIKYLALIHCLDGSITSHTFWQYTDDTAIALCNKHIAEFKSIELQTFEGRFIMKFEPSV